ncbi:DNA primase [Serinibacter salmoneus]|uniref:Primosomal protein n=1 Tax=Serinibacter salmoneus TaxID=556530 RepID=A0A2A9D1G2_9MICO|nr:DNA primase [Serinibacter salmoneus]PFG19782.1 hypothetical protein ATL40_1352 [Serinibacter salmoneus]
MATDPRAALDRLVAAFESHLEAARTTRDPDSDAVERAANLLADAFDVYDDALFTAYQVDTPFDVYDDEDEDDLEDDEDDEDYDDLDDDLEELDLDDEE